MRTKQVTALVLTLGFWTTVSRVCAGEVILSDIVRNVDESVRRMNQYDADSYCRNHGQRLPTARELTLYAQSLGAKGISEIPKQNYELVVGSDSAGNPDLFYYNAEGYQRPAGDLGKYWLWSSSIYPTDSQAYDFYTDDGVLTEIGYRSFHQFHAVRCVRGSSLQR